MFIYIFISQDPNCRFALCHQNLRNGPALLYVVIKQYYFGSNHFYEYGQECINYQLLMKIEIAVSDICNMVIKVNPPSTC